MNKQIFVSDGYPEAADYDSNFVDYDPQNEASAEVAKAQALRIIRAGDSSCGEHPAGRRLRPPGPAFRHAEPPGLFEGWSRLLDGFLRFLRR